MTAPFEGLNEGRFMDRNINPVYEWDYEDELPIVLGDPELSDELRRKLYEFAVEKYGDIEGGFESIEILSKEEAEIEYQALRREFSPILRGRSRAQKIFDFIMDSKVDDEFDRMESLNDFLADKPINAYVLFKLLGMILKNEATHKASVAAKLRHIENYELKKQAIDYWRNHINPKLSNPKAADILLKVVPLSHRKLVEYVAEAKRENMRPAS
jgi:hypothetical protein